jgi:hypothetical protein
MKNIQRKFLVLKFKIVIVEVTKENHEGGRHNEGKKGIIESELYLTTFSVTAVQFLLLFVIIQFWQSACGSKI